MKGKQKRTWLIIVITISLMTLAVACIKEDLPTHVEQTKHVICTTDTTLLKTIEKEKTNH